MAQDDPAPFAPFDAARDLRLEAQRAAEAQAIRVSAEAGMGTGTSLARRLAQSATLQPVAEVRQ